MGRVAGAGLWGRFASERQRPDALVSTSGADRKLDQWRAQIGLDAVVTLLQCNQFRRL